MTNELTENSIEKLKGILNADTVKEQFQNALKENMGPFVASVIDLYSSDDYIKACPPKLVVMEALKAATLKLPINKQLGFAYIVPYKRGNISIPQFQMGYKGYIQLAMRTGQYRFLNSGVVYEGQLKKTNVLTGEIDLGGEAKSDKVVGYFAYMELLNGFSKTLYMTNAQVVNHAKRYSKSYHKDNSPWKTNFEEMALKTLTRNLLSHYGIMSVEMASAISSDTEDPETKVNAEIDNYANGEVIDIESEMVEDIPPDPPQNNTPQGPDF